MIELGKKIVSKALKLGAEQAEAFLLKSSTNRVTIEKSAISFVSSTSSVGVGIRVIKNSKLGFAYSTKFRTMEKAIRNALSNSNLAKKRTKFSFPAGIELREIKKTYDQKIENLTEEQLLKLGTELITGAKEVNKNIILASGGVGLGLSTTALVNSEGLAVQDWGTFIAGAASTVLKARGVSTGFELGASRMLDLDFAQIGSVAAELAVKSQRPKKLASGKKDILLLPYAFSQLVEFALVPAFYGDAAEKGESFYSNKLSKLVTSKNLNLAEDSTLEGGLNSSLVDDEGIASKRTPLLERGVLKNYLYDLAAGAEYGKESTSNGVRCELFSTQPSFKAFPTLKARNIVIETKTKKYSFEDLLSELGSGILVYNVLGAHTSNPASGDFSVNSSLLFELKKGELAPCKPAMLSGNFPEHLKNIILFGNDYKKLPGSLTPVSIVTPTVGIANVRVTS